MDRPSLRQLFNFDETSLNVLLFVPLGVTVGLASSPRRLLALLGLALALPVAIEAIQLVATPLDRACQSGDVIDNVSGFLVGFVPALLASVAIRAGRAFADGGLSGLGERWRREP
jgi:glycopeptide antibiotics resistance protein